MKKILIILISIFIFTSCLNDKKENTENKIQKKVVIQKTKEELQKEKEEKEKKERLAEKKANENNSDKSYGPEIQNFIKNISKNYSSLKDIDCDKFKLYETKDYCKIEKEKYLENLNDFENKEKKVKDLIKKYKDEHVFEEIDEEELGLKIRLGIYPDFIVGLDCKTYLSIKANKLCKDEKKEYKRILKEENSNNTVK